MTKTTYPKTAVSTDEDAASTFNGGGIRAQVDVRPDTVEAMIADSRQETVTLYDGLSTQACDQLAEDAWAIGHRALENAYAQSQEVHLQDVCRDVMDGLKRQLTEHIARQQETTQTVLKKYFDDSDGEVTRRMKEFVDDQGVLARLLDGYLGPENSVLAQTLAEKVGQQSPLLLALSPTENEGVVQAIQQKVGAIMEAGESRLLQSLDPMQENGPMKRFISSLRTELSSSQADREQQLSSALAALDANDKNSLISRLMTETHQARQALMEAMNPDLPDSPIAALNNRLTNILSSHVQSQGVVNEQQRVRQEHFEKTLLSAVSRIETHRRVTETTPAGGFDFEELMVRSVGATLSGGPFKVLHTAHTPGHTRGARVGDLVVLFTPESTFSGSTVVFEAKRDRSYNVGRALEELEKARNNRQASVGVFVMAESHAPVDFPKFARHGQDILLRWNDEDARDYPWLQAATMLAVALAARKATNTDPGDLEALNDFGLRIDLEIKRLGAMEGYTANILRDANKISEEIRKARGKMDLIIRNGQEVLLALKGELVDTSAERSCPITLPDGGCDGQPADLGNETE